MIKGAVQMDFMPAALCLNSFVSEALRTGSMLARAVWEYMHA